MVFEEAATQILLADTPQKNEIPLLFIGYHAALRLTRGNRQALGFLITDQRILVQEDFSMLFGKALPKHRMLPLTSNDPSASSASLVNSIAAVYEWKGFDQLLANTATDEEEFGSTQFELSTLLVDAIISVVQLSRHLGLSLPATAGTEYVETTATSLMPRMVELGIAERIMLADNAKLPKMHKKFGAKIGIGPEEAIIFAMLDRSLIGVFGFVLTDTALRSCDLMEEPVVSLRSAIDPATIHLDAEKKSIIADDQRGHIFPGTLTDNQKEAALTLLREVISGRVA